MLSNMKARLALLLASLAVPCVSAAVATPSGLPGRLRVQGDPQTAFMLSADGVQIYTCEQRQDDSSAYRWVLVAPEATLKDNGATVGHHGGGPVWESTTDQSTVSGNVMRSEDGGA